MSFGKEKVWNWKTKKQAPEQPGYTRTDQEAKYNTTNLDNLQYGTVHKEITLKQTKPDTRQEGPKGA